MLSHDLQVQCQVKSFKGKLGGNEKSVPPSFAPAICCALSHYPPPVSGPLVVSWVCWGSFSHLQTHHSAQQPVSPNSSSGPGLWWGSGKSMALLKCSPSFPTQTNDSLLLSKILRDGDANPGKEMEKLFLLTLLLILGTQTHGMADRKAWPEMLKGEAGALMR